MRMSESEFAALMQNGKVKVAGVLPSPVVDPVVSESVPSSPPKCKQTKTEMEYERHLRLEFPGCEVRYEALALIVELDGERFRYTADFAVLLPGGGVLLVEVKNAGYQFASYGRAKLAFAAARVQWPLFLYRWVEKDGGSWSVVNF